MAGQVRRRRRGSLLPVVAVVLFFLAVGLAIVEHLQPRDGRSSEEGGFKIRVRYPSAEDSEWLDRWEAKYKNAPPGSSAQHGGFTVTPATDEESARLNRIFADADKGAPGYDGRIEWDDNGRPRIVVDAMHHSTACSSSQEKAARVKEL